MKTKTLLTSILLICISINTIAQTMDWVKRMGSTGWDEAFSIDVDNLGNVYTTGRFSGSVDFDPGSGSHTLSTYGNTDIFIQKLDSNGNLVWVQQLGGTDSDIGYAVTIDTIGNVFVTGGFNGTADFDPGQGTYNLVSNGQLDIFMLKLDSAGSFLWVAQKGESSFDYGTSVTTDNLGNVYFSGTFVNTTTQGGYDVFIRKYNPSGYLTWEKQFGGRLEDKGQSIALDKFGNVYTTGYFTDSVDFDPGQGTVYLYASGVYSKDIFIQKLDSSGNFLWVKQTGDINDDEAKSITIDTSGNLYTTGSFWGTVDFDPGPDTFYLTSPGTYIFVQKLDSSGNFVWAKQMGGIGYDWGNSIAVDVVGNTYITGHFETIADFDPGSGTYNLASNGQYDIFIQKLDSIGNFVWAKRIGGSHYNEGFSIATDMSGNIYTAGYFERTADFDPKTGTYNLASAGAADIFVCKWKQCSNSSTTNESACYNYTSPSGNYNWTTAGTYLDTIPNVAGCDSVITIILAIKSSTSTINTSVCDSFTSPSGNYHWTTSGTYRDTIPNAAGCDSAIIIELTVNNNASMINVTNCNNYISPSGNYIWDTSGTYKDTIPNYLRCDSVITINLTINNSTVNAVADTTCDSYSSPSGNYIWTASGTYLDTLTNNVGCDSVITVYLIINNSTANTFADTACINYSSPSGNYIWTSSGTYSDTIPNSIGCDSIFTINLIINIVDTSITQTAATLSSNADGAEYRWLDCNDGHSVMSGKTNKSFTATVSGSYAVEVIQNSCIDTSYCHEVKIVGIISNSFLNEINAFPNPGDGNITIDLRRKYDKINVTVTDINGKVIQNKEFRQHQILNLSIDKPKGVYIVKIQSQDEQAVIRIIKK